MKTIKRLLKSIILVALVALAVAFFNKNELPLKDNILVLLWQEPAQTETSRGKFSIVKGEYRADVEPLYEYEQWGLVVADYDSENWLDIMHEHNPFNTKDICLVWGSNVKSDVFRAMDYKHGEFTCFYRTDDQAVFRKFNEHGLANNHILPANKDIYRAVKDAKIGDQVHLKGQLVNYKISGPMGAAGSRNSSLSRTDRGNGACEVVYTEEFEVIKSGNLPWRMAYTYSIYAALGAFLVLTAIFIIELEQSWRKKDQLK